MMTYTIPKDIMVWRIKVTNEVIGTPSVDGKWESVRSRREVTYAKSEIPNCFVDDQWWYIFWLPMIAQPYVMIAVDKRLVHRALIP